jgi:hypothetical protein
MESYCNKVCAPQHGGSCESCVDLRCAGFRAEVPRIACSGTRCVPAAMFMF